MYIHTAIAIVSYAIAIVSFATDRKMQLYAFIRPNYGMPASCAQLAPTKPQISSTRQAACMQRQPERMVLPVALSD